MPTRVNWYTIADLSRAKLQALAGRLAKSSYEAEKGSGFTLGDVRSTYIVGTFIEKERYVDEIIDPFGNTENIERIFYKRTSFRISTSWPQFELYDCPRNLAPLLTTLSRQVDWF